MLKIGLTGKIGSGKSLATAVLKEQGALVIDADKVCSRLLMMDAELLEQVVLRFGSDMLTLEGKLDKKRLADLIFRDDEARADLNAITHPAILAEIRLMLDECAEAKEKLVAVEAALLLQSDMASWFDEVWLVEADEQTLLKRVCERDGIEEQQAQQRLDSQAYDGPRPSNLRVIRNDGTKDDLRHRVKSFLGEAKAKYGRH